MKRRKTMETTEATRRTLLQSLAALPVTALLLRPRDAAAQAGKMILFNGVLANFAPGIDVHVFGWAAETPGGWIGRAVDAGVATAVRDFPGTAAGVTMVVPKGMANTINGHTDKDGVRASTVCFADITGGSVMGSTVKLTGKLTHAENGMIFKLGDPVSLEGSKDSNEFTYTIRGGGKDNVLKGFKGQILIV